MTADVETRGAATGVSEAYCSVVTQGRLDAPLMEVWEALLLYEEIDERPPWHLRLLVPVPLGNGGRVSEVGQTLKCLYEGGHIVKRITRIQPGHSYHFEVMEQELSMGGGILLSAGSYTLRQLADGGTEVSVETGYVGARRPRWLWERVETTVCSAFHRHLLNVICRRADSSKKTP